MSVRGLGRKGEGSGYITSQVPRSKSYEGHPVLAAGSVHPKTRRLIKGPISGDSRQQLERFWSSPPGPFEGLPHTDNEDCSLRDPVQIQLFLN